MGGMTRKQAREAIGRFSNPSKMPCPCWSIPATECKLGSILRSVQGSTCSSCYARKGSYSWSNTENAMRRRFGILQGALADPDKRQAFVDAFTIALDGMPHFRWHDSGDLQSLEHLAIVVEIAKRNPSTAFWLPTREVQTVRAWIREHGEFPKNLTVRLSAPMRGRLPVLPDGVVGSAVDCAEATQCAAPSQDGECRDCRACWDPGVRVVSYIKH